MGLIPPLHILVIEDDADTRANVRDILELDDHRIEEAGSAAEALARGDWSPISAVILDGKLPDATADELLPRIRREAPRGRCHRRHGIRRPSGGRSQPSATGRATTS